MNDVASLAEFQHRPLLPINSRGQGVSGWFGVWGLVATEAALFGYLLFSYAYSGLYAPGGWPPDGPPKLQLAGPNTVILLLSSVSLWWGERGIRRGRRRPLIVGASGALMLGTTFVAIQLAEWHAKPFSFSTDLYSALFFTVTGFHLAHVVVGLLVLATLILWGVLGYFDETRHAAVSIGALYWHFVDAVWIAVFSVLYLAPYLTG